MRKDTRNFALVLFAALLASGRAFPALPAGARFVNLPLSVRQAGMGDTSMGGHDVMSSWSNPALLADMESQWEFAGGGGYLFDGGEKVAGAGAGWKPAPNVAVGALFSSLMTEISTVDWDGNRTGPDVSTVSWSGAGAVAYTTGPVKLGFALKTLNQGAGTADAEHYSVSAADFGASWASGGLVIAGAYRNWGGNLRNGTGSAGAVALPAESRLGCGYQYAPLSLAACVEYVDDTAGGAHTLGSGLEWRPFDFVGLRGGAVTLGGGGGYRYTAGFTVLYPRRWLGVDYAVSTHPLGLTHRFAISLALNPAASP